MKDLQVETCITETNSDRQARFESIVVGKLLRGFERVPGYASSLLSGIGSITLDWFNTEFASFPIRLVSYKFSGTLTITSLLKRWERTQLGRIFEEARDNYSEDSTISGFGVVFASHGDGMMELIAHTAYLSQDSRFWRIELPAARIWEHPLHLDPLPGFIAAVKTQHDWSVGPVESKDGV